MNSRGVPSWACPDTMPPILNRLWRRARATLAPVPDISAALWLETLARYPFLAALSLHDQSKLRALSTRSLAWSCSDSAARNG